MEEGKIQRNSDAAMTAGQATYPIYLSLRYPVFRTVDYFAFSYAILTSAGLHYLLSL